MTIPTTLEEWIAFILQLTPGIASTVAGGYVIKKTKGKYKLGGLIPLGVGLYLMFDTLWPLISEVMPKAVTIKYVPTPIYRPIPID